MAGKTFLFLQGPISPFFALIARNLEQRGHRVKRINLCMGDWLCWTLPGATNYRGRLKNFPAFIEAFYDREGVTDIVLLGEQRAYHRAAIEAAKRRGIRVTVTDFGYLRPDWITLERDGMSAASAFPRDPEVILRMAAEMPPPDLDPRFKDDFSALAYWDIIYHVASRLDRLFFPFYQSHQLHEPGLVYLGTGLRLLKKAKRNKAAEAVIQELVDKKRRFFLFPLQMETDFQLRAYSPFPDLSTPIRMVIDSFARNAAPDEALLVKIHPLDPGLRNWEKVVRDAADAAGVPDRVLYIDGGNLDLAIEHTRGVVTINSTVGVRTLFLGKPLIVLGEAIYKIKGLTASTDLDGFWKEPTTPDPELRDAFIRAIAGAIQIRGVFYNRPGLDNAVLEAVRRLDLGLLNAPVPAEA